MNDSEGQRISILLVDDHPAVRQGLFLLLSQAGYRIAGEAGTVAEGERLLLLHRPELVLLDISLEKGSGFELLPQIVEQQSRAIIYSMYADSAGIEKGLKLGASGYLTKREAVETLFEAIASVLEGKRYISPQAARSLADKLLDSEKVRLPTAVLSQREQEIADLICLGYSRSEIAEELKISPRTVESYYSRITEKLGLAGTRELRRHLLQGRR